MHQPNTKKVLISGYIKIDAKRQRSYEIDKNELLERLLITIFLLVVVCGGLHLFGIAYNHTTTVYSKMNEDEKRIFSVVPLLGIVILPGFFVLVFLSRAISRRKQAKQETNLAFRGYYLLSLEENTTLNRLEYGIWSVKGIIYFLMVLRPLYVSFYFFMKFLSSWHHPYFSYSFVSSGFVFLTAIIICLFEAI